MDLQNLAEHLGDVLKRRGAMLAVAESCTGGWLAQAVTAIAGSSEWFDRGFVTYSTRSKVDMLGVRPETLQAHGAVSEATVREMAAGALRRSQAEVAVAISGIAGPGGGSADKPVGTVWLAWGDAAGSLHARRVQFEGDREAVRRQAVVLALQGLLDWAGDAA